MGIIRCTNIRQGIIWNQPYKCVSSCSLDGSFCVSVVMCRPIASNPAEAPVCDSCYFKRKSAIVPSEFSSNENQSVSGTNRILVLITVISDDAFHIVSNCQMLIPRTSSSSSRVVHTFIQYSTEFSFWEKVSSLTPSNTTVWQWIQTAAETCRNLAEVIWSR